MSYGICYPPGTDWSCAFNNTQMIQLRADPTSGALIKRSEALAWLTLARLTGYQIGVCPITVRPCAVGCLPMGSYRQAPVGSGMSAALPSVAIGMFMPHIDVMGQWTNSCGCGSGDSCSCTALSEVILPGPVGLIEKVMVDGAEIANTRYRVDNGNRLVATDPTLTWPVCQDMMLDAAAGFSVTYYQGAAPNELTKYAAGVLANEFYKACSGGKCRLPAGVTSVARDGVTYEIQTGMFSGGFTGIREVDAVIGIYNPNGLKTPPTVTSPELRRARMTTAGRL
jgi:hypothetical protein